MKNSNSRNIKNFASLFLTILLLTVFKLNNAQTISQSYINTTRLSGGNFVAGDILEIRTSIIVPTGTNMFSVRVNIPVPANTTYQLGTLKITSNEAVTVNYSGGAVLGLGAFTDQKTDDRADTARTGATVTSANFRLGLDAAAGTAQATTTEQTSTGGRLTGGTTVPTFFGAQTIIVASMRVQINAAVPVGTIIGLGTTVTYKNTNGGADVVYTISNSSNTARYITLQTGTNQAVCTTGRGVNLFTTYNNGTFSSGNTQNSTAPAGLTGFTFINISTNTPNDGYVSVVNNTSADGTTGKVFSYWDIFGDHTGTTTAAGNAATPVGSTGGYLLIVNADYPTTEVATQTVTGLCPSTTYNFEAWFRNICPLCGADPSNAANNTKPGV